MKPSGTTRKTRGKTAISANNDLEILSGSGPSPEHIAVSAYFKAQARGFASGQELDDWLAAEKECSAQTGDM